MAVCLNAAWPGAVDQPTEPQLGCGIVLWELQSGLPIPGWACEETVTRLLRGHILCVWCLFVPLLGVGQKPLDPAGD